MYTFFIKIRFLRIKKKIFFTFVQIKINLVCNGNVVKREKICVLNSVLVIIVRFYFFMYFFIAMLCIDVDVNILPVFFFFILINSVSVRC